METEFCDAKQLVSEAIGSLPGPLLSKLEIVMALQVEPELRAGTEEMCQP